MQLNNLARHIDHTLLRPDATTAQITKLCNEATVQGFYAVCVNTCWLPVVETELTNSNVSVATVVGFPLGACLSRVKAFEVEAARKYRLDEIDMVIHIGALKEKRFDFVREDIKEVVEAAAGLIVKVIIETSLLSNEEKVTACKIAEQAGAQFVKTCTGFSGGGASVEDIQLMKQSISSRMQIKASGGIKSAEQAQNLIGAGATRLGTSSGIAIVTGAGPAGAY